MLLLGLKVSALPWPVWMKSKFCEAYKPPVCPHHSPNTQNSDSFAHSFELDQVAPRSWEAIPYRVPRWVQSWFSHRAVGGDRLCMGPLVLVCQQPGRGMGQGRPRESVSRGEKEKQFPPPGDGRAQGCEPAALPTPWSPGVFCFGFFLFCFVLK